jgi:glucose/mannose-6-phosphate isomerase
MANPDVTVLDNPTKIQSIDPQNVLSSIISFPQQISDAYAQTQSLALPDAYGPFDSILLAGMGGSGLGARIIDSIYSDKLAVPLLHWHDYSLPAWVNQNTLVIISSYSGTTEETISNAEAAIARHVPWVAIASGGELISLAKTHSAPYYQIEPDLNPSKQPRMAVGYLIMGQFAFAAKAHLITFNSNSLDSVSNQLNLLVSQNHPVVPFGHNPAKLLARDLFGRQIIMVAAGHLVGSAHTIKNQFNENAKSFSAIFEIPELNHHLMEGLLHPQTNPETLSFFMLNSDLYDSKISRRFVLTQEVVEKNGIPVYPWLATGKTQLEQAFAVVQFGSFVVYYLSLLYGHNPAPIPWVDYFKAQLVKD